jgi:hypothetical protein
MAKLKLTFLALHCGKYIMSLAPPKGVSEAKCGLENWPILPRGTRLFKRNTNVRFGSILLKNSSVAEAVLH